MKKFITYFLLYVIFCTLQFFLGKNLNIYGVFPNFILILIVYLGLTRGVVSAEIAGFLFGLTWDVFSTDIFGMRAVIFTITGYLTGIMNKHFNKNSLFTKIVIILSANLFYRFGFSFIYWVLPVSENGSSFFITVQIVFKVLITILITPVVFFILDHLTIFGQQEDI
ncbi:MAG: rod shape-determining protein MreD [Endomicrobium sp.]|jgi:rod shape-determining protein MreD|nr:rod shape-determining protein MreD [Endomicrobium sp.]